MSTVRKPIPTDPAATAPLRALARRMHDQVCLEAYDAQRGHFVEYYGLQDVDGSLLLLPLVGFLPINDPRIQGTIAAIQRDLMEGGLVLRRKVASTGEKEGAFIACTCWLADCLTMRGQNEQARELLERVRDVRNDVGLLAEEYDVKSKRLVGNFPQALSHLALINTALQLSGPVPGAAACRRLIACAVNAWSGCPIPARLSKPVNFSGQLLNPARGRPKQISNRMFLGQPALPATGT